MLSKIKNLFIQEDRNIQEYLKNGAVVIDVRTPEEFERGHVAGSLNLPLQDLQTHLPDLKKYKQMVMCCRSGNRSGSAKDFLKANGFDNVVNGGSWQNVERLKGN